jgi:hypothetical protein
MLQWSAWAFLAPFGFVDGVVTGCVDGIEMRFQPCRGPLKRTVIRRNVIAGNGEDGIRCIGSAEPYDREVVVEGSEIRDNVFQGHERDLSCGGLFPPASGREG